MSAKPKKESGVVYQFKITLKEIEPLIWRRIQVPDTYTFWDLHVAIQDSMGWLDCHLHRFELVDPKTGEKAKIGIPLDEESIMEGDEKVLPGWEYKMAEWFTPDNRSAEYVYDYGDGWRHVIEFEEVLSRDKGNMYPFCAAGERACPPEDCGGPPGYENILEILGDKTHEEYESTVKWLHGGFAPDRFDPRAVHFDDPQERWKIAFQER